MKNSSFFLLKISRSHLKLPTPGLENSSFNPPPKLTVSIVPLVEFPEKDLASSSRLSQPSHSPLPTPNNPYPHPSNRNLDPPLSHNQHPNNPNIPNPNVLSPASLTTSLLVSTFSLKYRNRNSGDFHLGEKTAELMVVVHTWWMNGWRGWRSCMDGGSHAG